MTKIANKLGLIADANEESIIAAITAMENKNGDMEAKLKKAEEKYNAAQEECDKLKAEMDELKEKAKKAEDDAKKAEDEAKKSEAKNMVEGFAKSGKIKNEAIDTWVELATADFAKAKNMLEQLPTNKTAAVIHTEGTPGEEAHLTNVIAKNMAEIRNRIEKK